ncbi:MAG: BACON domain-containing protein [Bacteroidales bacterium]
MKNIFLSLILMQFFTLHALNSEFINQDKLNSNKEEISYINTQNISISQNTFNIQGIDKKATEIAFTENQITNSGPPSWTTVSNLQYNMNIIGKIQLSTGVYSLNDNDIIAAFVGTECRGIANPYSSLGGMLFLTIGSNVQSGENVSFKIYLASTDEIVNVTETIAFQNAGEIGTMTAPFNFSFVAACNLSVTPANQNAASTPAGSVNFTVTTNCSWTAVSNQTWCTITPSGSGNSTITANYSINSTNSPRSANITVTVSGFSPQIVTLTQSALPTIVITPLSLDFGNIQTGGSSSPQSYTVSGTNLISDITITAPAAFQISKTSGGTYSNSLSLTQTSGNVNATLIYVKFSPLAIQSYNGQISNVSTSAVTQNISVSGTGICSLSITPSNQNVANSPAGSTSYSVTTNCAWTATSNQTWCTITPSGNGNGNGTITANYTANTNAGPRIANITVTVSGQSPQIITLTQAGTSGQPSWIPTPNLQYNMNIIGKLQISSGVYSTNVNDLIGAFVGSECRGVASPYASLGGMLFLTIGSNVQSGETVSFKAYLASTNEIVNINETILFQNAGEFGSMANPFIFTYAAPCTLAVTPSNQNALSSPAASTNFSVTTNCPWTAISNQTWCTVTPSGSGNGTITASYSANTSSSSRSANITVTVAGLTPVIVTVTQTGVATPPLWNPTSNLQFNMNIIGKIQLTPGIYSLNENDILGAFVGTECRGVASPFSSIGGILFLTIGSNLQSGETVSFKVYLAASNQIVNVNETIAFVNAGEVGTMPSPFIFTYVTPCSLSLTPSTQNIPQSPSGNCNFTVTTNCAWTATSNQSWCTVTPSGTGNGTITATYSTNTTISTRTANITVTVAGLSPVIITLSQAALPTITVTPTSLSFGNIHTGSSSTPKTYSVSGVNLTSDISITAQSGYQVSYSSSGIYSNLLTLTQTSGNVNATLIYVKFSPTEIQSYNFNITNSSTGAISQNVALTGAGICTLPSASAGITGLTTVFQGQNNVIYTVPAINNSTSYEWTLPTGLSGSSLTNSISINFGISANSGNIKVKGLNACGYGDSALLAITVIPSPITSVFTAAVSNVWENAANWDHGIPGPITNASIAATKLAIVNSNNLQCNNLTIAPLAKLTINAAKDLKINSTLTLMSDGSGSASLIDNGSLQTTTNIVERYIPHTNTDEFHMLASPLASQPISPVFNETDGFYVWNEATANWIEFDNTAAFTTVNGGSNFVPGRGYAISYPTIVTKTFSGGNLNTGTINIPLTVTAGLYSGWNFIANPYSSAINWNAISGWSRNILADAGSDEKAIWVWNAATANYGAYISNAALGTNGVSRLIPSAQGFWVKASISGNLSMNNSIREHADLAFLKSTTTIPDMIRLSVNGTTNTYSDELIIKFGNTNDLGGAEKMFSMDATAPGIYSTKSGKKWSISMLTTIADHPLIPVGFKAGVNGSYTITASDVNNFTTPCYSYLKDLTTNTITDLNQNASYTFTASSSDNTNRFQLLFAASPMSITNPNTQNTSIYIYNNNIYINSNEIVQQISIYNTLGQLLKTIEKTNNDTIISMKDYSAAYYIIKVQTTKNVYTKKLLLN